MKLLDEFDSAIVALEKANSNVGCGYLPENGKKTYDSYLDNESWKAFLKGMTKEHFDQYGAGSGGELEEKDGKPPKMAAFASSSRMIYNYSKDIPGFRFEEKLPTTVGGTANMDGYLERENEYIFVEAKCREPYSHKAEQEIKQAYKGVYAWLRKKMPRVFSCVMEDSKENNMRVAFFCKGKVVAYFDIKQMICHMLGIATKMLKNPSNKNILFLYFLYNPASLNTVNNATEQISSIWKETCDMALQYEFSEMFGHIVDYLVEEKGIAAASQTVAFLKNAFRFELCDQNTYRSYF